MRVIVSVITIAVGFFVLACGLGPDMSKDRIQGTPTPTPFVPERPIAEYLADGGKAYSAGNFAEALVHYKRAFEIEQREQKLEEKQRNELIKNTAMTYVRTGDLKNARTVIAYGLSKDYDNSIFRFTLACTYASEGDESSTLFHLRTAYRFRDKLPKGEVMPDPLSDSCFESFSESDTFKKGVAEMKRTKPGTD